MTPACRRRSTMKRRGGSGCVANKNVNVLLVVDSIGSMILCLYASMMQPEERLDGLDGVAARARGSISFNNHTITNPSPHPDDTGIAATVPGTESIFWETSKSTNMGVRPNFTA
jgi:hypothetical protein